MRGEAIKPPTREQELQAAATEYLTAIRDAHELRYDEVEAWAWARLQARLKIIRRKKAA